MTPGVYIHYKGGRYLAVHNGIFTGNHEGLNGLPVVFYHAFYNDGLPMEAVRVRPEYEWSEQVEWPDGKRRHRFMPIKEVPKELAK